MTLKGFHFYILTRHIQVDRTFYALGALRGQGVSDRYIVVHYGPECTDYDSIEAMQDAFLEEYPGVRSRKLYKTPPELGCYWGSLSCIKRFIESEHSHCYFVQDDFVPVCNNLIDYPIADILSDFRMLLDYDPDFEVFLCVYQVVTRSPNPALQIHPDFAVQKGLNGYGDMGLILSKSGARYVYEKMIESAKFPEDVLKASVGTPAGDSFYISLKGPERYEKYLDKVQSLQEIARRHR